MIIVACIVSRCVYSTKLDLSHKMECVKYALLKKDLQYRLSLLENC